MGHHKKPHETAVFLIFFSFFTFGFFMLFYAIFRQTVTKLLPKIFDFFQKNC